MSSKLWKTLSDQEREWVLTAAAESSRFQRQLWFQASEAATQGMKEKGVTIHRPDISIFKKAADDAAKQFLTGEVKTIAEEIQSLGNQ